MTEIKPFSEPSIGKSSRGFVRENFACLKTILLPIIFLLILTDTAFLAIDHMYKPPREYAQYVLIIMNTFLYAVLALYWHRVVILGEKKPFRVQIGSFSKHDLTFIKAALIIDLAPLVFSTVTTATLNTSITYSSLFWFLAVVLVVMFNWQILRACFYFPAAACGKPITIKQARSASEGITLSIFKSCLSASWRIFVVGMLLILAASFIPALLPNLDMISMAAFIAEMLIISALSAILAVLNVTVISKYYMEWRLREVE